MALIPVLLATWLAAGAAAPDDHCRVPLEGHRDTPGCFLAAEVDLADAPDPIYWHLVEFAARPQAEAESARHRYAVIVEAHGHIWLEVLGAKEPGIVTGRVRGMAGPLALPPKAHARLMAAWTPPGGSVPPHVHGGAEALYVVEGKQCIETREGGHRVAAGEMITLPGGPHVQAMPEGRRSLAVLIVSTEAPATAPVLDWTPTGYCGRWTAVVNDIDPAP